MAIPTLYALQECSDFTKTVEPFIPQLYALPSRALEVLLGREGLLTFYLETNPLIFGFAVSVVLGAVFLVVSEINRNYSQVDRCWSLLPTFYIAHFKLWASLAGISSPRLDAALLFGVLWSIRLTYNYWRKGGYTIGSEDYRWEIVHKQMGDALFRILNWTFISFIQSVLLFAIAAPAYILLLTAQFDQSVNASDLAYLAFELGLIVTETFADQQQWNYQTAKKQYQKAAKVPKGYAQADLDRGFITSGLWGYSRHPNFAAEQTIWFVFYHWACFASNALYNWTLAGPVVLILLFQGSTWLTERITSGKYIDYSDYQRAVGMFIPTSFTPYAAQQSQPKKPKVIRTSELEKKLAKKQK